jgi:hypothetical protein
MAGLPHYNNSKAARNNYEPVFLNQFEVLITPPSAVTLANVRFNGESIMTQQVKSVTGSLAVDIQPGGPVTQYYKFAERRYAGGEPSTSDVEFSVAFEVNLDENNSMTMYKILRQWSDLIYNPLTGAMGLKRDYVGQMVISIFNKQGDVFRRITLNNCFPVEELTPMSLNYESGDSLYVLDTTWKSDYWQDQFL